MESRAESHPPNGGMVRRWHPLTKLALLFAAILISFADLWQSQGVPLLPWLLLVLLFLLAFLDGRETGTKVVKTTIGVLIPLFISFVVLLGLFYAGESELLWQWGWLSLKREGLVQGMTLLGRAALAIGASLLLLNTTDPADLTHALTETGVPREFAYVLLAAMQLLPRMQARADAILKAQAARGLQTEGGFLVRARALLPVTGPLITSALNETSERALALEVRAFRAPGPKTSWRQLRDSAAQRALRWLLLLGSAGILIYTLWQRWNAP